MCNIKSSLLIEHETDRQVAVRHPSGPGGPSVGAVVELAGSSLHYWSHFPFQVTDHACVSAEPFQGRILLFFSINNLDA